MRIFYGKGAYRRDNGNLPELKLRNMFVEATPASEDGAVLLSRKGLSQSRSIGTAPIRGVFQQPGVFDGAVFSVTTSGLYRDSALIGAIAGSGPVSFAGNGAELLVTAGETLYSYNGTTLAAVSFPDSANVLAVEFHDGLFLAARKDSHKYYWSGVLDGRTWNALSFASAESRPDKLLDLKVSNDTLWLFGEETIEPWSNTGAVDAPYQRFEQRIFSKGLKATGCVVEMDNTLFFVAHDNMAYRIGDVPERVSDHGIEARIAGSASISCFGYIDQGHSFFCVRGDDFTLAYDVATQQWCELTSWQRANFRGQCATKPGDTPLFGDDTTGIIWTLDGWQDGSEPLERLFTAAIPMREAGSIDTIAISANTGWTEDLAGQGSDPVVEMRPSRDAGATFSTWRSAPLGQQGEYRTRSIWRRLGLFDPPGALFEFRCTDPCPFRAVGVYVNEPGGGRSRA